MTQNEVHLRIDNIERTTFRISLRQIIIGIATLCSIVCWWATREANAKAEKTEIINLIDKRFQDQGYRDSLNFMKLNNKIDLHIITSSAHFDNIEEKIKAIKPLKLYSGGAIAKRDPVTGLTSYTQIR